MDDILEYLSIINFTTMTKLNDTEYINSSNTELKSNS